MKLNKLGDVLQILEKHVDFAALTAALDLAAARPGRTAFWTFPERFMTAGHIIDTCIVPAPKQHRHID